MSRHSRRLWAVFLVAVTSGCASQSGHKGAWPPEDFRLEVEYAVGQDGQRQVRQHLLVTADGLAVYREADESVRSAGGRLGYPVFQRMCAYRMQWRSVRHLSRILHEAPVKDLVAPIAAPRVDGVEHSMHFDLTYLGNRIDVVARNQAVGLMNRALRIVNQFLPTGSGFAMPSMAGEPLEPCLQDVPVVTDSLAGALRYHEAWMGEKESGAVPVRAAFALACTARDMRLAALCIARMTELKPAEGAAMQKILGGLTGSAPPRSP